MKKCLETCHKLNVPCPIKDCRYWINFKAEKNCTLESVDKNGSMTLRETADRLGISYVRVKQIQDKTLKKISHLLK
jgi:hypothetical protein